MTTWRWRRPRTTTDEPTSPGRGCRPQTRYGPSRLRRPGVASRTGPRRGRRQGGRLTMSPGVGFTKRNPGSGLISTGGQFCPQGTLGSVWGQFWLSQVRGPPGVGAGRPGRPPDTSQCAGRPPAGDSPAQRVRNVDVATRSPEMNRKQAGLAEQSLGGAGFNRMSYRGDRGRRTSEELGRAPAV